MTKDDQAIMRAFYERGLEQGRLSDDPAGTPCGWLGSATRWSTAT